jgi:2-hydroxy-6-oxonona-2,4-dienedioate hydrolase
MAMRLGRRPRGWEPLWLEADGFHLYTRLGTGSPADAPAVVLVQGMVVSSRYMIPLLEKLAPYFRVYAPDLPGYGRSQKVPHALSPSELADVLVALLDAAGLEQACFVGNSYGCNIIAELAVHHPQKVTRAVLQGPAVEADARNVPEQLLRLLKDSRYEPNSMSLILARDYAAAGVRIAWETVRQVLNHPIEERLPDMQVPTMVVRGSRDAVVSQQWAEELTSLLPDGRLRVIPGAAHTLNYAMPLEFSRVIRPFLEGAGETAR